MKKSDKKSTKNRLFEIISIGNRKDPVSYWFDIFLVVTIILNVTVMFLETFDVFSEFLGTLRVIEFITVVLFCIEYILRIYTADCLYTKESKWWARLHFMRSFEGIIDLLSIIPFGMLNGFAAFRLLKVVRIFRVFRVSPSLDSFNIISLVLKEKRKQIASSVVIILVFMMASSLAIYSVENEAQPEAYSNAFSGLWWSMSTLLTIGYGDIYPITIVGKILAFVIAFLGVGLAAIPTGIISAGFVEQYSFRTHAEKKLSDINEIGEIAVMADNPVCGRTIDEIEDNGTLRILLIIRGSLKVIPVGDISVEAGDILVVESERISKKMKKRK